MLRGGQRTGTWREGLTKGRPKGKPNCHTDGSIMTQRGPDEEGLVIESVFKMSFFLQRVRKSRTVRGRRG